MAPPAEQSAGQQIVKSTEVTVHCIMGGFKRCAACVCVARDERRCAWHYLAGKGIGGAWSNGMNVKCRFLQNGPIRDSEGLLFGLFNPKRDGFSTLVKR